MPIEITPQLSIPEDELTFVAARSSGPGGQNVNKVNTRVILTFDVAASPSLDDEQRLKVLTRLATRISRDGVLRVGAQAARSQLANKRAAIARFVELLQGALHVDAPRTATRPTRASRERRLTEKSQRSVVKRTRQRKDWNTD